MHVPLLVVVVRCPESRLVGSFGGGLGVSMRCRCWQGRKDGGLCCSHESMLESPPARL